MEITEQEIIEIALISGRVTLAEVAETMQGFLDRERALFENMPENPEARKAMIYGMACLTAIIARLDTSPGRTSQSESETSPDSPSSQTPPK